MFHTNNVQKRAMLDTIQDTPCRVRRNTDIHARTKHEDKLGMTDIKELAVGHVYSQRHKRLSPE